MISSELKAKINNISDYGEFWRSETGPALESYADDLIEHGFDEDEAFELIEGMFSTVSGEYGN